MTSKVVAALNPQTLSCRASAITNNSHLTAAEELGSNPRIILMGSLQANKQGFLGGGGFTESLVLLCSRGHDESAGTGAKLDIRGVFQHVKL